MVMYIVPVWTDNGDVHCTCVDGQRWCTLYLCGRTTVVYIVPVWTDNGGAHCTFVDGQR